MKHFAPKLLLAALCVAPALAAPASAQEFPLTIAHKFGTTTIEEKPERVATLDTNGADNLLALGIQPVVIENWFGGYPRALWPWADPLLEETPIILERGEINFELIAKAEPDVILSLWNDLTAADYEKLSLIAPVVAMPAAVGDFDLAWDERAILAGRAVGRETEAIRQVEALRARMAEIADAHPEWQGKSATVGYVSRGQLGAYASHDSRPQILAGLGFVNNPAIEAIGSADTSVQLSEETRDAFQSDLLLWLSSTTDFAPIYDLSMRPYLDAPKEGREVFLGKEITGAFSFGSLLSLPHALDLLVPVIETALDGDPTTNADDRPNS